MKLRVRKEEADQVRKLMATEDVRVFENPAAVREGFFGVAKNRQTLNFFLVFVKDLLLL